MNAYGGKYMQGIYILESILNRYCAIVRKLYDANRCDQGEYGTNDEYMWKIPN